MRPIIACCLATVLVAAACRDSQGPEQPAPLRITTDSSSYTRPASWSSLAVEFALTNNSTSTVWIGSCGEAYSSFPGTLPVIAVYGTQLISYATTPPRVGDVAQVCSGDPVPYALAPGKGVRMSIIVTQTGSFSFSAPFSATATGAYDQRTISPAFTIVPGS